MRFTSGQHNGAATLFLGLHIFLQMLGQAARVAASGSFANWRAQHVSQTIRHSTEMHFLQNPAACPFND